MTTPDLPPYYGEPINTPTGHRWAGYRNTSYRGVTVERIFPSGMHRIYVVPFPIITDGDPHELIDDIRAGRYDGEHYVPDTDEYPDDEIPARLAYLRGELRAERMSYGELAELQGLAEHIDPGDVELLEAAGVPEHADTVSADAADFLANRPHYDGDHVAEIAALREADGTPYCRECHDWHNADEDHSTITRPQE